MKILLVILSIFSLLVPSAQALEYQQQNLDGRKIPAKAYYQRTGGVYDVMVQFNKNRATIYFAEGGQTTIKLRQQSVTDLSNIEGIGGLRQIQINQGLSFGLENDATANSIGTSNPGGANELWRINIDSKDLAP